MNRYRSARGFTLIESVVTLVIVSVLAAVSLPNIYQWASVYRLSIASQELVTELRLARARAVSECRNINFIIIPGRGCDASYQIVPDGPVRSVSQSITIRGVSGDNPITFNSRGLASNDTTIELSNNELYLKDIHINVAGRVEIN